MIYIHREKSSKAGNWIVRRLRRSVFGRSIAAEQTESGTGDCGIGDDPRSHLPVACDIQRWRVASASGKEAFQLSAEAEYIADSVYISKGCRQESAAV